MKKEIQIAEDNTAGFDKPADNLNGNPRQFRFIGDGGLSITGRYSGKIYRFEEKGQILEVDYLDSLSFMAEYDLVPVSNR